VEVVYGADESFVGIAKNGKLVEVLKNGRYAPGEDRNAAGRGHSTWYWRELQRIPVPRTTRASDL
jgi:hypothetical protein